MDLLVTNEGLSHLALHILSYVDIKQDITNCRLVCKDWQVLIDASITIWKRRLNFLYDGNDKWEDFREAYITIKASKDLEKVKKFVLLLERFFLLRIYSNAKSVALVR